MSKFIAIEGCDQVGKNTQQKMLVNELRRRKLAVKKYSFPNYGASPIARIIKLWLNGQFAIHDYETVELLFVADKQNMNERIKKDLAENIIVVADRHYYSGIVYASAKDINYEWAVNLRKYLVKPHISLFLDVNLDEKRRRSQEEDRKTDRYEKDKEMQQLISDKYKLFAEENHDLHTIDANGSKEDTHNKIIAKLEEEGII